MTDALLVNLAFFLPLTGLLSILFLPHAYRAKVNFLFVSLVAAVTSMLAVKVLAGHDIELVLLHTRVFGTISLHVDSLSAWFILIINLTCINGAFYGMGYMRPYAAQKANLSLHWMLFLLFQASMLWVCMVQHTLVFLMVWELMSISSFLLVIFDHENKSTLQAGIQYLVQMHIGVLFLVAAFIWVYMTQGSFAFSAIEGFFASKANLGLFLLFFAGFGLKAGFIPLHSWLPQAHPAAPSHISGIMSGVIVKVGIYGILRMVGMLRQDLAIIGGMIIILSVLTGLFGILNAAVHRDFKKMLAYCTIENIGIIGIGIGLGVMGMGTRNPLMIVLGFSAALLHTLNHSLFKSLLFFNAGSVYQQTHTRDMERLGGLVKPMPRTAALFLAGSLAICGLPPFNGFVSEFILYSGLIAGIHAVGIPYITLMIYALAGLALIGGVSMLTFTKSFGTIFLGTPRMPWHHAPQEVSWQMRGPQYFILLIMLSIGIFPQVYFSIVKSIVWRTIPALGIDTLEVPVPLSNGITTIGLVSLLFLLLVAVIYAVRTRLTSRRPVVKEATWGCGYADATPRMQYTGKSFSKSLGKLLSFIVLEQKQYRELQPKEIFPEPRQYASHYHDFFVKRAINVIADKLLFALNYFQFIQNGRLQMYILYGILFICLILFGTLFNVI